MRKKSHISLARYIVENLGDEKLKKHKFSFYLGSVLPDIKPSFVYKRHELDGTFSSVSRHIKRLSEGQKTIEKPGRKYYMDLGQISHYLADYFTFPHNAIYPGSLKEHCSYEEKLKKGLRAYLKSGEAARNHGRKLAGEWTPPEDGAKRADFGDADAICSYIKAAHEEYLERKHNVKDDIEHIVEINHRALGAMIDLLARRRSEWQLGHS